MINTLIISGGNIEKQLAFEVLKQPFEHMIAVDGGLRFCYEQGIVPTRIVGDFDTLEADILDWYKQHTEIEIREFHPVKDSTDTQIAVELSLELQSESITILGGTGTRLDHVFGNVQTMYLALEKNVPCQMLDPHNRIQLIKGRYCIKKKEQYGDYFSLIPLTTDVTGVTIRGAKYPLEQHSFSVLGSGSLGVSNEIVDEQAEIEIGKGIMILIESKD
ncbi:MAG: thiamine diphosphokinase [Lachnospiraceae bacterium]|nr:thiamine diphosphokinase [Lachnospiraceae bacterium]